MRPPLPLHTEGSLRFYEAAVGSHIASFMSPAFPNLSLDTASISFVATVTAFSRRRPQFACINVWPWRVRGSARVVRGERSQLGGQVRNSKGIDPEVAYFPLLCHELS